MLTVPVHDTSFELLYKACGLTAKTCPPRLHMLFTKPCAIKACKMHCMQLLWHITWHWSNMLMQHKGCPPFSHASRHFYVFCTEQETQLVLFIGFSHVVSEKHSIYRALLACVLIQLRSSLRRMSSIVVVSKILLVICRCSCRGGSSRGGLLPSG